jgi:hypothetical protein
MHLQPLVDTDGILIAYDQDNGWLYVDWKGVHTPESSRLGCIMMLECLRQRPCPKILNDNSSIIRTEFHLTEWSMHWLRDMHAAGLEALAWVYPQHFNSRAATESTLGRITQPILATFDDLATAYLWLKNYQTPATIIRDGWSGSYENQPG